jgi:CDP-diacylglycerol--glycerol-3-phosphate 3-phosphatidyltransferase
VLLIQWGRFGGFDRDLVDVLEPIQLVVLWSMLAATIGSGVQYLVKAVRLLSTATPP